MTQVAAPRSLAARGESPSAFDERYILAASVAPPSNTGSTLGCRALPARRLTRLGATPDFHHGLLGAKGANTLKYPSLAQNASRNEVFLTTEEVLEHLQINLRTVYRLIKAGKIPAVRMGRQWRFGKRDIDAWLDSQGTTPGGPAPAAARKALGAAVA